MKACVWVRTPDEQTPGVTCGNPARYLVAVPGSGYMASCRRCMVAAIVQTTDHEYRIHRAGHREPVEVLPADER